MEADQEDLLAAGMQQIIGRNGSGTSSPAA